MRKRTETLYSNVRANGLISIKIDDRKSRSLQAWYRPRVTTVERDAIATDLQLVKRARQARYRA
jgi:hypothetical protein